MKRKAPAVVIVLLAGAAFMLMRDRQNTDDAVGTPNRSHQLSAHDGSDSSQANGLLKTKASQRVQRRPPSTHPPQRLREFILPEVMIDGLSLEQALRKLNAAYQEACVKTGETPLDLVFKISPGSSKSLQVKLPRNNFNSSVHLLASLAGMKASRSGKEYRFEPITNDTQIATTTLKVPPDFSSRLQEIAGIDKDERLSIQDMLTTLGLDLDPSSRISLSEGDVLQMDSRSTADVAVITELLKAVNGPALQHKYTSRMVDIPADANVTLPDVAQITDADYQVLMMNLNQGKGVYLTTMPSITGKNGDNTEFEVTKDLIWKKDGTTDEFESERIGTVLNIQGSALGFGHDLAYHFTHSTGELDPVTRKPLIDRRTDISDSGFSGDRDTRISVQTRPDGSKTLILITPELLDATGRPLRPVN
ncbi:MAG: hypothetical protein EOP85_01080 [Verrucomicrobiaceae bacterium]|nr:MAG: hypothetical protein EOP85_01080 [Verrucomicrobiaceae bacterium]